MNAKEKTMARNKACFCPIKTIGFAGGLRNAQSVHEPLVAVMSSHKAEAFRIQGLRIAAKIQMQSPSVAIKRLAIHLKDVNEVQVAVKGEYAICAPEFLPQFTRALNFFREPRYRPIPYRAISTIACAMANTHSYAYVRHEAAHRIVSNQICKRSPKRRKKICSRREKDPEIRLEPDKNGRFVIVVIYSTQDPPSFKIKFERHHDDGSGQPDNIFLKVPNQDMQIIKAITEASHHEFGGNHKGQLRYGTEAPNYKTKPYTDTHLLVCLFFYIHVNRLNISTDFYIGQRAKLLDFCKRQLKDQEFQLCSESYFTRCITSLDTQKESFESFLVQHKQPTAQHEKGMPDMLFWYEIYKRTESLFMNIIPRETSNK